MTPRKQSDDLDALLDRLEDVAVAITVSFSPMVTVVATKRQFDITIDWSKCIEMNASNRAEVQNILKELGQHLGLLPTKITIPRN